MKLERMIGILAILLQQEKVTAPWLAQIFEVSRRTINRDVEALCMAGIPLMTKQGAGGGISIAKGYKMDRSLLTTGDMQAILAGLRSLDSVSGTNRYALLMEKLSAGASRMLTGDEHILIDLSDWDRTSLCQKMEEIYDAIRMERTIHFAYFGPKGQSRRTIEPYDLVFHWGGWYVWGRCLLRQAFRLFKLNRMTDLTVGEKFERTAAPIPDLSPENVFPPHYQVKARIAARFQWRLLEEYGPDSFVPQEDGTLLFSFGFTNKEEIIRWIASFGDGAELLEPRKLRRDMARFVDGIRRIYDDMEETESV